MLARLERLVPALRRPGGSRRGQVVLSQDEAWEIMAETGAQLVSPHRAAREHPYRLGVGLVGLEAMLRLFTEQERNPKAFEALTRFLDALDKLDAQAPEPPLDPLVLSFQLKLLWLSGYLPHLAGCAACGEEKTLVGFSAQAGGGVCAECGSGSLAVSAEGFEAVRGFLERPLAEAAAPDMTARGLRECLSMIESSYEYHGGFRLRTLAQRA